MLKDNHNFISNTPNPSIRKGTVKAKLIEFIENTLFMFQKQFKGLVNDSEEVLNEHLSKTFTYLSKSQPFFFQPETRQRQSTGHDRRVDIGVFKHYADIDAFFTIEAKRLTTSIAKNREKEYILGNNPNKLSGGIERFKHNVHGINLTQSAIIGYVQNQNASYWYNTINTWIQELIDGKVKSPLNWNIKDSLKNICKFKDVRYAKFISENEKVDNTIINLNHYFINLCS